MSLQGELTDLPLIDLVQLLTLDNKTGILSVNRNFSQAQIYFNQARVYSAYVRHTGGDSQPLYLQGEAALYDLLSWVEGHFFFNITASLHEENNVNTTWNNIVLEHFRRQDEQEQRQNLDWLSAVRPRLLPNPSHQAQITLDLEDWQVLLQISGLINLREISDNIRRELAQVVKIVEKLEKQGLLEIDTRISTTPLSLARPQTGWKPGAVVSQPQTPGWRNSNNQQVTQPSTRSDNRPVSAAPQKSENPKRLPKPQVQRSLLAGIMAKIRGL